MVRLSFMILNYVVSCHSQQPICGLPTISFAVSAMKREISSLIPLVRISHIVLLSFIAYSVLISVHFGTSSLVY